MRTGLHAPFPHRALDAVASQDRWISGDRISRVQIDDGVHVLRTFPEWIKRRIIEILAIGMAVDHCADETEIADTALQLFGGAKRVLHGEMRQAAITSRIR